MVPQIWPFFTNFGSTPEAIVLLEGLNKVPMRYPLQIWYSPEAQQQKTSINRCVNKITGGAAIEPWWGLVLVLKFSGTRKSGYIDAGSRDLSALSAYFVRYTSSCTERLS